METISRRMRTNMKYSGSKQTFVANVTKMRSGKVVEKINISLLRPTNGFVTPNIHDNDSLHCSYSAITQNKCMASLTKLKKKV